VVTRGKKEIIKLVQVKTMRLVQVEKQYVRNQNGENTIQNICLLDSQILLLMHTKGHNVYFCMEILAVDSMALNKLKRHLK